MNQTTTPVATPAFFRQLAAIALLGAAYKSIEDADILGEAVELTLAEPAKFKLYRALAQGIGGDAAHATEHINRHLDAHPEDEIAKVTLGISLLLGGSSDWRRPIDNVLATSSDQEVRASAMKVIDLLEDRA